MVLIELVRTSAVAAEILPGTSAAAGAGPGTAETAPLALLISPSAATELLVAHFKHPINLCQQLFRFMTTPDLRFFGTIPRNGFNFLR